ncbi:MAG: acetylxylan esterase [Bacteroidota bacterium]
MHGNFRFCTSDLHSNTDSSPDTLTVRRKGRRSHPSASGDSLGWRIGSLLLLLLFFAVAPAEEARSQDPVVSDWVGYPALEHGLYERMMNESIDRLDKRHAHLETLTSAAQWRDYQSGIRDRLREAIGPFPERTPLNARTVGTLEREAFTVEKVIFESRPGYHVTAALYLPKGSSGPHPAVVYASGHTSDGFRSATYQRVSMNLAERGFAVLAFDPVGQGERHQYLNEEGTGTRLGGPTREHSYAGAQMLLSGDSMVRSMIWDGMRSVDYLLSREDIDPDRIGMTGRSGGGTQTALVAALDERVAVAVPENYITTLSWLFRSIGSQDAEQNIPGGVALGLDHGDLLLARAPKPTMLIATTRDFFSIQGARQTSAEVRGAWEAMGRPDAYDHIEDDHGHGSTPANRERMVRFFQTHLQNPGPNEDLDPEPFTPQELKLTESGQVRRSLEGTSIFDLQLQSARSALKQLAASRAVSGHGKRVRQAVRRLSGYEAPSGAPEVVFTGRTRHSGYSVETGWVPGVEGQPIPWVIHRPEEEPKGVLLWIDPRGKAEESGEQGRLRRLAEEGWLVVAADLPGVGELGQEPGGDSIIGNVSYNLLFSALHNGRSLAGMRAGDLTRLVQALHGSEEAAARGVTIIAREGLGAEALHTATMSRLVDQMVLLDGLSSWSSLAATESYDPDWTFTIVPGALRSYDLPDLAVHSGVRQLWVRPRDGAGETISESAFWRGFGSLLSEETDENQSDHIEWGGLGEETDWKAILGWIETENRP